MLKRKFFAGFLTFLVVNLFSSPAMPEQIHTFQIEQDGAKFECRVSLPRDTFLLLENIKGEFWMKNISQETVKFTFSKPFWWTIRDENNNVYRHPDVSIPLKSFNLKPGDSIGGVTPIERLNYEESHTPVNSLHDAYFPLGKYRAYFGPETLPFVFVVTIKQNSKKHLQIKAFYDFVQHDFRGRGQVDTAIGIAFSFQGTVLKKFATTDPIEMIYEFLETYKKMIGLDDPRSELKVKLRGRRMEFQQEYKGVKVSGGGLRASITPTGKIDFDGSFHTEINISAVPKIDSVAAIRKALIDLKFPTDYQSMEKRGSPSASLIVFPFDKKYYLAWLVEIYVDHSPVGREYYIDALSGRIIHRTELIQEIIN
ncbi:MAG TPA: hypothetical protein VNL73_05630 [Verrucomicrobiae bacterium]|nr:hypothetical protein [Verrucomicrobiae bacterium]